MLGGKDQVGSREVWSLDSPYPPVKVFLLLSLDPTLLTLVQLGAKVELQPPAHNGASGFCTASVQMLETEAKSGESSHTCRGVSVPLPNEAVELPEARDELLGARQCPEGVLLCP